jgi:hypothetical protein
MQWGNRLSLPEFSWGVSFNKTLNLNVIIVNHTEIHSAVLVIEVYDKTWVFPPRLPDY